MSRDLSRRLEALERRLPPPKPRELTEADWIALAAHKAVRLVYVLGPATGEPMARLYAAISAGNTSSDRVQSHRFSLAERFEWAVRAAAIRTLGPARGNDWEDIELPSEALPKLTPLFDFYLAELPARHPELISPEARPATERYHDITEDRKLYQNGRLIDGAEVAAFGVDTWEGRN